MKTRLVFQIIDRDESQRLCNQSDGDTMSTCVALLKPNRLLSSLEAWLGLNSVLHSPDKYQYTCLKTAVPSGTRMSKI